MCVHISVLTLVTDTHTLVNKCCLPPLPPLPPVSFHPQVPYTMSSYIRRASVLNCQVDEAAKEEEERNMAQMVERKNVIDDELQAVRKQIKDIDQTRKKMQARITEKNKFRHEVQKRKTNIKRYEERIEELKRKEGQNMEDEVDSLNAERLKAVQQRCKLCIQLGEVLTKLVAAEHDNEVAKLKHAQAKLTAQDLNNRLDGMAGELGKARKKVEDAEMRFKQQYERLLAAKGRAQQIAPLPDPVLSDAFEELPGDLDSLETKMAELTAEIDSIRVMPAVIEQYRKRIKNIRQLEEEITDTQANNSSENTRIERVRGEWLPKVRERERERERGGRGGYDGTFTAKIYFRAD